MKFGLLGPLEVIDGPRLVPIQSPKHRAVLAALLLRPGEVVSVDEMVEAVWGDELPASPRRAIQTYVSRLRQILGGAEAIQIRQEGYVLNVSPGDVDASRFALLLETARAAAVDGDRHAEAEALRQALALWRGEPLADVASETLCRDAATRLAEQRMDALERRIEADLELGRLAGLVPELYALTSRYPLREHLWALLMTALYRRGRQADALKAYQSASRRLADDVGVDPGPGLRQLHRAILAQDPALAGASPSG